MLDTLQFVKILMPYMFLSPDRRKEMTSKFKFITLLFMMFGLVVPAGAQNPIVHAGVILDGRSGRVAAMQQELQKQITEFFSGEYDIRFTPENTVDGAWTAAGVRAAVERMLADQDVDLILALGLISSNEMALRRNLSKPVIACAVIDAQLQGFPKKGGASGVKNLVYLDEGYAITRTIRRFQDIVPFKKLAVMAGAPVLEAMPQLHERMMQEARSLGTELALVPVAASSAASMQVLPADVDAVFLAPLLQLPDAEFDALVAGLNRLRLPTFSYFGKEEVEKGVMAAYAQKDGVTRRARRIASTMQRILRGEDAGALPVDFAPSAQLVINMATARAIGFQPNWTTLAAAELINVDEDSGRRLSLAGTVRLAVEANLDLLAEDKAVEAGAQEVNKARASLLPQVGASAAGTLIRKESAEASLGLQSERQLDGALSFSQSLFSENNWSRYAIEKSLQNSREQDRHRLRLDIALQAASAYLNVLRAKVLARIQRSNLKVSLDNLELARLRESIGASGRSDLYRWESQVATGRKDVIDADAQIAVAITEVNRLLNRPLEERFATEETGIDDPVLITSKKELYGYFANPKTFAVFREFMVEEGVSAAPELKQLEAAITAQKRAHTAAGRSFWMPEVSLQGGVTNVFDRSGADATPQLPPSIPMAFPEQQEVNWSIKVQLSLPLFTGLGRSAVREQTGIDLARLTVQRQAAEQSIGQRIRAALHTAGASYAGIEQSRAAAEAARKNLELVTDAYGSGAVSIITLIDAQNAALVADEAAANAVYDFLLDLMNVERAIGRFDFFASAQDRQEFMKRLEAFYQNAGEE